MSCNQSGFCAFGNSWWWIIILLLIFGRPETVMPLEALPLYRNEARCGC